MKPHRLNKEIRSKFPDGFSEQNCCNLGKVTEQNNYTKFGNER